MVPKSFYFSKFDRRDDKGDYPMGTYVRNSVGSTHNPFSQEGCLIYIKTAHLG
ncbi:MAG: cupin domain-containing protein [Xenococcaceae cyanobacterium]